MKTRFSDEDQETIRFAQESLERFDKAYLSILRRQGVKGSEAKRLLFDNRERQRLVEATGELISLMQPIYVFERDELLTLNNKNVPNT